MTVLMFCLLIAYGVVIATNFVLPAFDNYGDRAKEVTAFVAFWSWLFVFFLSVADVCATLKM